MDLVLELTPSERPVVLVDDFTRGGDENCEWHPDAPQLLVQGSVVFGEIELHTGFIDESECLGSAVLKVYTEEADVVAGVFLHGPYGGRQLSNTRWTPRCPKVHNQWCPFIGGEGCRRPVE